MIATSSLKYIYIDILYLFTYKMTCLVPRQWYDILGRGADNDILQVGGFLFALKETLRLRPGALLFAGVPCSRWFACIYDAVF